MQKTLFLAGIVILYVGMGMLLLPFDFFEFNSSVTFDYSIDKSSEFRAMGAFVVFSGLYVTYAAVAKQYLNNAYFLALVTYGSFSFGRVLSIVFDGNPSSIVKLILFVEILLFSACLIRWMKHKAKDKCSKVILSN